MAFQPYIIKIIASPGSLHPQSSSAVTYVYELFHVITDSEQMVACGELFCNGSRTSVLCACHGFGASNNCCNVMSVGRHIASAPSLSTFRLRQKTYLSQQSFPRSPFNVMLSLDGPCGDIHLGHFKKAWIELNWTVDLLARTIAYLFRLAVTINVIAVSWGQKCNIPYDSWTNHRDATNIIQSHICCIHFRFINKLHLHLRVLYSYFRVLQYGHRRTN